jgi:hypothetical protein
MSGVTTRQLFATNRNKPASGLDMSGAGVAKKAHDPRPTAPLHRPCGGAPLAATLSSHRVDAALPNSAPFLGFGTSFLIWTERQRDDQNSIRSLATST